MAVNLQKALEEAEALLIWAKDDHIRAAKVEQIAQRHYNTLCTLVDVEGED